MAKARFDNPSAGPTHDLHLSISATGFGSPLYQDTKEDSKAYNEQVCVLLESNYKATFGLGKNAADPEGRLPITTAIKALNYPAFKWNIARNPALDLDFKDISGKSPLDYLFSEHAMFLNENEEQKIIRRNMFLEVLKLRTSAQREKDSKIASANCDISYFLALYELQQIKTIPFVEEKMLRVIYGYDEDYGDNYSSHSHGNVLLPTHSFNLATFLINSVKQNYFAGVRYILGVNSGEIIWADIRVVREANLLFTALRAGNVTMFYELRKHFSGKGVVKLAQEVLEAGKITVEQAFKIQSENIDGEEAKYILLESNNQVLQNALVAHQLPQDIGDPLYERVAKENLLVAAKIVIKLKIPLNKIPLFGPTYSPILDAAVRAGSIHVFKELLNADASYAGSVDFLKIKVHYGNSDYKIRAQIYLQVIKSLDEHDVSTAVSACSSIYPGDGDDLISLIQKRYAGRYVMLIQDKLDLNPDYRKIKTSTVRSSYPLPTIPPSEEEREYTLFERVISTTGYKSKMFTEIGQDEKMYTEVVGSLLDSALYAAELSDKVFAKKERQNILALAAKHINYPAFIWLTTHPAKDINYNAVDEHNKTAMDYVLALAGESDERIKEIRKNMFRVLLLKRNEAQRKVDCRVAVENSDLDYYLELTKLQNSYKIPSFRDAYNHIDTDYIKNLALLLINGVKRNYIETVKYVFEQEGGALNLAAYDAVKEAFLPCVALLSGNLELYKLLGKLSRQGVIAAADQAVLLGRLTDAEAYDVQRKVIEYYNYYQTSRYRSWGGRPPIPAGYVAYDTHDLPAEDVGYIFVEARNTKLKDMLPLHIWNTATFKGSPLLEYIALNNLSEQAEFLLKLIPLANITKSGGFLRKDIVYCPALDKAGAVGSIAVFKQLLKAGAAYTNETVPVFNPNEDKQITEKLFRVRAFKNILDALDNLGKSSLDPIIEACKEIHNDDKQDLFEIINTKFKNKYIGNFQLVLNIEKQSNRKVAPAVATVAQDSDAASSSAPAAASSTAIAQSLLSKTEVAHSSMQTAAEAAAALDEVDIDWSATEAQAATESAMVGSNFSSSSSSTMFSNNASSFAELYDYELEAAVSASLSSDDQSAATGSSHSASTSSVLSPNSEEQTLDNILDRWPLTGSSSASASSSDQVRHDLFYLARLAASSHAEIWRKNPELRALVFQMATADLSERAEAATTATMKS